MTDSGKGAVSCDSQTQQFIKISWGVFSKYVFLDLHYQGYWLGKL